MGWKETLTEKTRDHIVTVLFGLIVLLLLVIWRAVPFAIWDKVLEVVPKQVLWALIALELIVIGLLTAFALDSRRKRKNTPSEQPQRPVRRFGIHWDDEFNPLCPVCEVLLHIFYPEGASGEVLRCPKCKAEYRLRNDDGEEFLLYDVKRYLNGTTTELQ
jgi:hypothetical protein